MAVESAPPETAAKKRVLLGQFPNVEATADSKDGSQVFIQRFELLFKNMTPDFETTRYKNKQKAYLDKHGPRRGAFLRYAFPNITKF
jgi:hypothetical protein